MTKSELFFKYWRRTGCVMLILCSFNAGCGKKNNSSPPVLTYHINPTAMITDGCLNLSRFSEAIQNFPPDTMGRRFTTSIKIEETAKGRKDFTTLLARGNFQFEDRLARELYGFTRATQNGCASASLIGEDGDQTDYTISHSSPASLDLFTAAGTKYSIELLGPTTLKVVQHKAAVDPCNNECKAEIEVTDIIQWGDSSVNQNPTESVSAEMISMLAASTEAVPAGVKAAIDENKGGAIQINSADLVALRDSPVRIEVNACFPAPEPLPPPPEVPRPSPTPVTSPPIVR